MRLAPPSRPTRGAPSPPRSHPCHASSTGERPPASCISVTASPAASSNASGCQKQGRQLCHRHRRLPGDHRPRPGRLTRPIVCSASSSTLSGGRAPAWTTPSSSRHSAVPANPNAQLTVAFLSLVSMGELGRNPTVKDEIAHSRRRSVMRADVHLPGAPGRRRASRCAVSWRRSAPTSCRTGRLVRPRPTVRRALRAGVPGARAGAQPDPAAARADGQQMSKSRLCTPSRSPRRPTRIAVRTREARTDSIRGVERATLSPARPSLASSSSARWRPVPIPWIDRPARRAEPATAGLKGAHHRRPLNGFVEPSASSGARRVHRRRRGSRSWPAGTRAPPP